MAVPPINDQSHINIAGQTLGHELQTRLTAFENGSAAVAALFVAAAHANVTIKIIHPGPDTGGDAVGPAVTMASHVIYAHGNTGPLKADGLDELAESTLFEVQNAINNGQYTANSAQLSGYHVALIPYGHQHARIEAQSSWLVGQAIRQRGGNYHPSAWGVAQEHASHGLNQVQFENHFIAQPHSTLPKHVNTSKALPSGDMYAFEALGTVIARPKVLALLDNVFTALVNDRNTTRNKKQLLTSMDNSIAKGITQNADAASVYCWFVDWIATDAHFTTRTWRFNQADWEFTPAMKALVERSPYKKAAFTGLLNKLTFT